MKTTIDKLAHKYALNIKQIRGPGPTKIADFKNLNKNFYDDIESSNITIKDNSKILNKIKNHSIKEFIYSNKVIPYLWKNKLNYQDELLDLISKDKKLLSYLGSTPIKPNKLSFDKFPKINVRYDDSKSVRNRNIENNNSKKEFNTINEIYDTKNSLNNNNSILRPSMSMGIKNKYSFKKKGQLSQKEINALMDDYKTAYPIKEKLNELYITSNYYNINNNNNKNEIENGIINNEINTNDENKLINTKKSFNSVDTNHKFPRHTFTHTDKKLISKKQRTFRQNIFNNLSSSSEDKTFYPFNKVILNKNKAMNRILNISNENKVNNNIRKIIEINNPIIKRNVESINYYGPYFSFCPSCRNKNINFYSKLDPNKCLELIHLIKKVRQKNTIVNAKRTCSVSPKKKPIVQKETLESENGIISNNNFTENEQVDTLA